MTTDPFGTAPPRKPALYREVIDALVDECHGGQGQIGPARARQGVWNPHITAESEPEQHAVNLLLGRLAAEDREILARMLAHAFESGVFNTLKVLETFEVAPFEEGYEGSPYHDFIGRLAGDWEWPEGEE